MRLAMRKSHQSSPLTVGSKTFVRSIWSSAIVGEEARIDAVEGSSGGASGAGGAAAWTAAAAQSRPFRNVIGRAPRFYKLCLRRARISRVERERLRV